MVLAVFAYRCGVVVVLAVHHVAIMDWHALLGGWWWACYGIRRGTPCSYDVQVLTDCIPTRLEVCGGGQ